MQTMVRWAIAATQAAAFCWTAVSSQPAYGSPQPSRGGRFFAWIRSSQVKRGHDRWIGGVCDGIARRLGWNTTLVRALMVVATLFFGAGAAFYGLAWFVLPDERDNQILAEDLINGKWDWNCIGALLCCLVAICLPGAGWFAFALAALVLWLLLNRQIYAPNVRPAQWAAAPVWSGSVRSTAIWSASIWKSFVRTAGASCIAVSGAIESLYSADAGERRI